MSNVKLLESRFELRGSILNAQNGVVLVASDAMKTNFTFSSNPS